MCLHCTLYKLTVFFTVKMLFFLDLVWLKNNERSVKFSRGNRNNSELKESLCSLKTVCVAEASEDLLGLTQLVFSCCPDISR